MGRIGPILPKNQPPLAQQELPPPPSNKSFMPQDLLGFDIGGTKCAVVLGRITANGVAIRDRLAFATGGLDDTLAQLEAGARELIRRHGAEPAALGISCGGPLDSDKGVILGPPNLPGWDDVPVTEHFSRKLGIPARLQNDANACALAEWRWGAGRGAKHMIFLTFGTGFGAGLILNGQLYEGATGYAGEVGHVRLERYGLAGYGKHGSVEGFLGSHWIARMGQKVVRWRWQRGETVALCAKPADLYTLTAKAIFDAARAGDPVALEVVQTVGYQLGRALAMLLDLFNPEIIVIGSNFVRAGDLLLPHLERALHEEALPHTIAACRILPAALGEQLGDYAALSVAASAL